MLGGGSPGSYNNCKEKLGTDLDFKKGLQTPETLSHKLVLSDC